MYINIQNIRGRHLSAGASSLSNVLLWIFALLNRCLNMLSLSKRNRNAYPLVGTTRNTDTDPDLRHHHGCSGDGAGRPEDVLPVRGAAAAVQLDPAHQLHHPVDPLQHTVQPGEWQGGGVYCLCFSTRYYVPNLSAIKGIVIHP